MVASLNDIKSMNTKFIPVILSADGVARTRGATVSWLGAFLFGLFSWFASH